jgi:hypothetical protein
MRIMAVPTYDQLMQPTLDALHSRGGSATVDQILEHLLPSPTPLLPLYLAARHFLHSLKSTDPPVAPAPLLDWLPRLNPAKK